MLYKKWISRFITFFLFVFVAIKIVPQFYSNWQNQGTEFPSIKVMNLASSELEDLFSHKKNFVIFWASWCAPCKLEMNRVKRLVEKGEVNGDQVIALNPFEGRSTVQDFMKKEEYPFRFLDDGGYSTKLLEVSATPTFLWIDDQRVVKMNTGIHLTGLFRLESFLKD